MSVTDYSVTQNLIDTVSSLGRGAVSALYPRDIESYFIALELANANDETIDYFIFPISPDSITIPQNKRINVKQSAGATTVITSKAFTPYDLQIRGNFGKSFKIVLAGENITFSALRYSILNGRYTKQDIEADSVKVKKASFDAAIKTGYGCTKILQSIIDKSDSSDENGNFRLYLYNSMFGESYLTVPTQNPLTFSQNVSSKNMIWDYTLNLKVIAPLDSLKDDVSNTVRMARINSIGNIQSRMTSFVKSL